MLQDVCEAVGFSVRGPRDTKLCGRPRDRTIGADYEVYFDSVSATVLHDVVAYRGRPSSQTHNKTRSVVPENAPNGYSVKPRSLNRWIAHTKRRSPIQTAVLIRQRARRSGLRKPQRSAASGPKRGSPICCCHDSFNRMSGRLLPAFGLGRIADPCTRIAMIALLCPHWFDASREKDESRYTPRKKLVSHVAWRYHTL
jgi:hypothetical protein